jgi:pimeloyl-ACP methyl ester carboxylesterase
MRYQEAGQGEPLVSLHGAGGMRLYRSHALLAAHYRVIVFEVPGFGQSPTNERSQSMSDLAHSMAQAMTNLGIERFNLMGNSFGGKLALWMAVQQPERIQALVLVAPAAIRPEGAVPPAALSPEELMARLYAHPERQASLPHLDPAIRTKQQALVRRVIGPPRDEALESRLPGLHIPVLVLFGTMDRMLSPEMGRLYCEKLPNCHLILMYDAGHEVDADRPEAFVSVVSDFLQHHEAFLVNRQSGLINP